MFDSIIIKIKSTLNRKFHNTLIRTLNWEKISLLFYMNLNWEINPVLSKINK